MGAVGIDTSWSADDEREHLALPIIGRAPASAGGVRLSEG
jgi:hypothetical protein